MTAPTAPGEDSSRLSELLGVLSGLSTEAVASERGDLDLLDTAELVHQMNREDQRVPVAVAAAG